MTSRPENKGKSWGSSYSVVPECLVQALEEVFYAEGVNVVKKLKPETGRDDLTTLFQVLYLRVE